MKTIPKTGDTLKAKLAFGHIAGKTEVNFIWVDGIGYIADKNIKTGVSYEKLEKEGLVEGVKTMVEGVEYVCRILTFAEWDEMLKYSEDNDVWHWKVVYSWVRLKEFENCQTSNRAVRGNASAADWYDTHATGDDTYIGFRPALIPLQSSPLKSEETVCVNQSKNSFKLGLNLIDATRNDEDISDNEKVSIIHQLCGIFLSDCGGAE
jgi:hypothetical protein